MQRHKVLNRALIIIGALIVVLGVTLVLTVPQEVKDLAQVHRQRILSGEWGPGRGFGDAGPWEAPPRVWGHRGFPGRPGFYGAGHIVGFLGILVIVLLVGGFLVRRAAGFRQSRHGRDAVEILREKYASGEIGKDEFAARKRVLENDSENE
jgi:uncharacterized membrane protein